MDYEADSSADAPLSGSAWRSAGRRFARTILRAGLLVGLTWMMFFQLGSARGRPTFEDLDEIMLVGSPDGPLVIWILSWSAHALRHQPTALFDANMFHPSDNSLAYTETMAPLAPLWALIHGATGNPVLALNLLLLLLTVLNAWGGYLLASWLTGRTDAGVLAAVLLAFNGYASAQRMHLQLQVIFLVPIAFLLLFRWLEERDWRYAVLLALSWAALAVTVVYYGVLFTLMIGVVLVGYLIAKRLRPGRWFAVGLATAVLLAALLVAPFAAAYLSVPRDRGGAALRGHDLDLIDLVTPSVGSRLHGWLEALGPVRSEEHRHFPGFLAVALAAVGSWSVVSAKRTGSGVGAGDRRLYTLLLALAGAACLVLAFGESAYGVPLPFRLVRTLPVLAGVRVPSRLVFGALVALSVLAAVGYVRCTAALWRPAASSRRRVAGALVAAAVISVAVLENSSQTRLFPVPVTPEEALVNRALAAAPPGAVLELPIATGVGAQPARMEAKRFMLSILDWKPRVNGYSGGYPEGYFQRARELARFPAPRALRLVCELEVRYVVLRVADPASHPRLTPQRAAQIVSRLPRHARWERHGDDVLIDMADWLAWRAGRCPMAAVSR